MTAHACAAAVRARGAVQAVLFDYDGVVALLDHATVLTLAHRLGGFRVPPEHVLWQEFYNGVDTPALDAGTITYAEFWRRIRARVWSGDDRGWERFVDALSNAMRPNPEVLPLVRALASRVPLALVTDNHESFSRAFRAHDPLSRYFEVVVCSADLGVCKPEPGMYDTALRALGLSRSEVLYVDDSARNVEAARALGLRSHLYRGPSALRRELAPLLGSAHG